MTVLFIAIWSNSEMINSIDIHGITKSFSLELRAVFIAVAMNY